MTETATIKGHIKASKNDPAFKYEPVKLHNGKKLQCFQCGTCTPHYSAKRYSNTYGQRQITCIIQPNFKKLEFNEPRVKTLTILKQVA